MNDSDDDVPPQLVEVLPPSATPTDRPKSPGDHDLPRVPITIVTGN